MKFQDKVAVVTGGSGGIGSAVARRLAVDGAQVAVVYSSDSTAANQVCSELTAAGASVRAYQCDVTDPEACHALVKDVTADLGPIEILVNNAGIVRDAVTPSIREEDFQAVLDVSLGGSFHMIKECYFGFLRRRSGSIINISSIVALTGAAGQSNYAAAKSGVIGLTKSVARELASRGIRCNAIAPGIIDTDMTQFMADDPERLAQIPMGRFGEPAEVAALVAFLAGDDSRYITGEVIRIDGGLGT